MIKIEKTASKGSGVFAEKDFREGEIVVVGTIEKELVTNDSHASQIELNRFVIFKDPFRSINHSCDPNCGIKVNTTGAHDIVAKRPIAAGSEITFDYAMQNYSIDHFPSRCECGATQCRGTITGWKGLPIPRKEEYRAWAAHYLFELDKVTA